MEFVLWIAPLIVLLASCTRGIFGFGDSLVAVPLLMLVMAPMEAVATVALVSLAQGMLMLARERRDIDWSASRRLLLAAAIGVPFGLLTLKAMPVIWVKRTLAVVLIGYATRSLLGAKLPEIRSGRAAAVAGFLSGALGAAYNFAGPPVILYSSMAKWSASRTRATLQAFFTPLGVIVGGAHLIYGSFTPKVLEISLICLPAMVLGVFIGGMISRKVDASTFRKVLDVVLICLGITLWL